MKVEKTVVKRVASKVERMDFSMAAHLVASLARKTAESKAAYSGN